MRKAPLSVVWVEKLRNVAGNFTIRIRDIGCQVVVSADDLTGRSSTLFNSSRVAAEYQYCQGWKPSTGHGHHANATYIGAQLWLMARFGIRRQYAVGSEFFAAVRFVQECRHTAAPDVEMHSAPVQASRRERAGRSRDRRHRFPARISSGIDKTLIVIPG